MESAGDKSTQAGYSDQETLKLLIQEQQEQQESGRAISGETEYKPMVDCAPSSQDRQLSVERVNFASPDIKKQLGGLQPVSPGLTYDNVSNDACEKKLEGPAICRLQQEGKSRHVDLVPEDYRVDYLQKSSSLTDKSNCPSLRTERITDPNKLVATSSAYSLPVRVQGRPASNPVNTHNPEPHKVRLGSHSSTERQPTWVDCATQPVIGPTTFKAGSTRPTSVPDFKNTPPSRGRRTDTAYPNYPDQSFAALQSHYHAPTYQPPSLRTRSSQSSHNASYSSDSSAQPGDFSNLSSGAKTVGNTPSQSPGLFSPSIPRSRPATQDSEDGMTKTPTLHPAHNLHLQTPIETNKLLKDVDPISGRKTLNEYELFEKLGSGQHGTVKLGRNLVTQSKVAVKIVRRFSKQIRLGKHGDPSDSVKKEIAILKKARHPHVVSLLEVIDDHEYGKVYLVLEFVERGEIVWRKKTDKDIANFEMKRVRREKAGIINEAFEREELERFNESAPVRRLEKVSALQKQKDRLEARSAADVATPFWSLEYGEASEDEPAGASKAKDDPTSAAKGLIMSQPESNPQLSDISPQGSTPKQHCTPKAAPLDAIALETVTPESLSRQESTKEIADPILQDSSAHLQGTMYGPYVPQGTPADESLRWKLQDFIDEQEEWSKEEEQYMYVPCLTIQQTQQAFRQTVLGLEYLHFQGIIHRDIKPANLLWTEGFQVKISDFGVSYLGKPIRRGENNEELSEANPADAKEAIELAKTVGTPAFYAPELCDPDLFDLEKNPERPRITGQIDVWALGVTLYCMIFGRLPFVDSHELGMYEKIAREEVFIPQVRLRGVENSDKDPETNGKRMDDIIEYELVDDELQDLIRRLLHKDPSKRISLREVKHHPWVLRGINDQSAWVDETDPSLQSQGKKIEISNEDVAGAVVPVTLVDRVKAGLRRLGSVVRGREGRKRTDSSLKTPDSPSSAVTKVNPNGQEARRSSLRGDEQIFTALRASREGSEHPLSQSVTASPEMKTSGSYFDSGIGSAAESSNDTPYDSRPSMSERTLSNAESARTVRAIVPAIQGTIISPGEPFSSTVTPIDASSSSSLGGIFGGAGRRFVNSMRSRERGRGRDSPSRSSRSSSADTNLSITEDPHASPSLAISSAVAAGHVDQPPVLREEPSPTDLYQAAPTSSPSQSRAQIEAPSEAYHKAQEQNFRRQILEAASAAPTPTEGSTSGPQTSCPASPDDDVFFEQQHQATPVGVSSSSDQIASGMSESFSHPSVPSVVSGASSFSAANDVVDIPRLSKDASPLTLIPRNISDASGELELSLSHDTEAVKAHTADDDEAGYNGEGEMDSDSDDDMLMMGPKK